MSLTDPIGKIQALTASLLLLGAVFVSLASLGFEHIGGYPPCQLCYIQRHVHYAMIPLSLLLVIMLWRSAPAWASRLFFVGLACLLLYGGAVGVYQAGAEWELWLGPANCTNSIEITNDASQLLAQLEQTKLVNCSVAQLRILGLSFGGWNVVLSSGLVILAMIGALARPDAFAVLFQRLPVLNGLMPGFVKS